MSFDEQPDPLSDCMEAYDKLKAKYASLEAKLKLYEGGEYEAQVKALEAEVKKWKGREAGMAQNHLDELGLRLGLEESLKSCQEALAKSEARLEIHGVDSRIEWEKRAHQAETRAIVLEAKLIEWRDWAEKAEAQVKAFSPSPDKEPRL